MTEFDVEKVCAEAYESWLRTPPPRNFDTWFRPFLTRAYDAGREQAELALCQWLGPRLGLLTIFSSGPDDSVTYWYWFGEDPEAHTTLFEAVEAFKAHEEERRRAEDSRAGEER